METLLRRVDAVVVHSDDQAAPRRLPRRRPRARARPAAAPPRRPARAPARDHDGPPPAALARHRARLQGRRPPRRRPARRPRPPAHRRRRAVGGCRPPGPRARRGPAARGPGRGAPRVRARRPDRRAHGPPRRRRPDLPVGHRLAERPPRAAATGVPVLASAVGTFPEQVRDGVDGLLVPPSDREALVAALRRLAEPGCVEPLRAEVRPPDLSGPWANYVGGIEALAAAPVEVGAGAARPCRSAPVARARATVAGLRARRGPLVEIGPADFPERVRATDLLAIDADAVDAVGIARALGLPRPGEPVAAWSALGALAAILRIRDDGHRSSVIVDESGSGSPMGRWARAVGFAPVELELTGRRCRGRGPRRRHRQPGRHHPAAPRRVHGIRRRPRRRSGLVGPALRRPARRHPAHRRRRPRLRRAPGRPARRPRPGRRPGAQLVGDVDGDVLDRMRDARVEAEGGDAPAYAVLRLTFRRR